MSIFHIPFVGEKPVVGNLWYFVAPFPPRPIGRPETQVELECIVLQSLRGRIFTVLIHFGVYKKKSFLTSE